MLIPGFKAQFLSDGSVTTRGSGTYQAGGPPFAYRYEVDLQSGTYTTQIVDPSQIEKYIPQEEHFARNPAFGARSKSGENPLGVGPMAVSPGGWWGSITVLASDPLTIIVAETYTDLAWTVFNNGTVDWDWYSDGCWAANLTIVGTHWFTRSCSFTGVWFNASHTQVCHEHRGSYYNYDFADDSLRTDVNHWERICGRNDGYYNYGWSHTDSGEWSSLLFGFVVLNM